MTTVAVTRGGPQAAVALAACAAAGTACLVWALRGRYLQVFLGTDPEKGGGNGGNGEKERQGVTLTSLNHLIALTGDSWHSSLQRLAIGQMVIGLKLTNEPRLAAIPSPLPDSLAMLASLRDVDLSANGLSTFPDALLSVPELKKLNLSRNKLTSLPQPIRRLSHLEHLDLGRNHLSGVPEEIGHLTKLLTLNLMCNQLESLPDSIGRLTRVFRLGLKSNRLSALPSSTGGMTSLVELYLTDNRLTALPDSIGCCTNLVKLQASFNELYALPDTIGHLSRLELLRLAANNLHALPSSLALLPRLAWLSLASNPLCPPLPPHHEGVEDIPFGDLQLGRKLGDGASGDVYAAVWHGHEVVFKQFNSETSPDGRAVDEIAMTAAVDHPHLVQVLPGGGRGNSGAAAWAGHAARSAHLLLHTPIPPTLLTPHFTPLVFLSLPLTTPACQVEATVEQPHGLVMRRVFGRWVQGKVVAGGMGSGRKGRAMADPPNGESLRRCRWPPTACYLLTLASVWSVLTSSHLSAPPIHSLRAMADPLNGESLRRCRWPPTACYLLTLASLRSVLTSSHLSAPPIHSLRAMADPPNGESLLRCRWPPSASYSLATVLSAAHSARLPQAMADPPNGESLLRCRWSPTASYSLATVVAVGRGLASALEWMHARGWAHGDVYAHNVLVDDKGFAVLCDYGELL
ncbi:unnamed protein product [Closterium sp. NIES-64]|nr:unnamed protein product [Closterium sp. NIES-64]